jgi:hypothetical protein
VALAFLTGFEAASAEVDLITLTGTAAYSTAQARTGSRSIRCNPASGASGYAGGFSLSGAYFHFGLFVASLPTISRQIYGAVGDRQALFLNPSGTLSYYSNGSLVGTSSVALATSRWYWIGVWGALGGGTGVLLEVDGAAEITGTSSDGTANKHLGLAGTEASAIDIYFDDAIGDDTGFLDPSKVALFLPVSDGSRSNLWTTGTGGTTSLFECVNNTPPAGLGTETNTSQIEHAGGSAVSGDTFIAYCQTYTTAGINPSVDTILGAMTLAVWGEDSGTGTKLLRVEGYWKSSYVALTGANTDVSSGHGTGATVNYTGTSTDYWNVYNVGPPGSGMPSLAGSDTPEIWIRRPETAARVASVCFMGMYMAWTPAAAADTVPRPRRVYPQLLAH